MGYRAASGEFLLGDVQKAGERSGLELEYYKTRMSSLNKSLFSPCNEWGDMSDASMINYLQKTGDVGGVMFTEDGYNLKCADDLILAIASLS